VPRFGRLRLFGANGSQLLPLQVPFETQYRTGIFFAVNALDRCTSLMTTNLGFGNFIGNLDADEVSVNSVTPLSAGRGAMVLGPPGAGNNGSIDLTMTLGETAAAAACPAFAPLTVAPGNVPWLRSRWCGSGHDRDPAARVRFGIRPGAGQRIFMRENY
jgi:hypothetical protein